MRLTAVIYMIATLLPQMVMAQQVNIPPETKHINLTDKKTGEPVGSIHINGDTSYLRDAKGEHVKTIVRNKDGTATVFDPNGKIIETKKMK